MTPTQNEKEPVAPHRWEEERAGKKQETRANLITINEGVFTKERGKRPKQWTAACKMNITLSRILLAKLKKLSCLEL